MQENIITKILGIQDWDIEEVKVSEEQVLIRLKRKGKYYCCNNCRQMTFLTHDCREQKVRDLDMSGKKVYLIFWKHRVRCKCSETPQEEYIDFVDKHQRYTRRFENFIYQLSKYMTIRGIAKLFGLSWGAIEYIALKETKEIIQREDLLKEVEEIAVDEIAYGKWHKYLTIVTNLKTRKVIWIGKGRKKKTLDRFFIELGEENRKKIKVVVTDMWEPYVLSIKKHIPTAEIVLDKFHLMKQLNTKLDELRKAEQKKIEKEGAKVIYGERWIILKGKENLTERQRIRLEELCQKNEPLYKGYLLKEDFREFLTIEKEDEAKKYFADWAQRVVESGIKQMEDFLNMTLRWSDKIFAYFRNHITTGVSEGINNKIRTILKMGYGYRNTETLKLKIYQLCAL